MTFPFLRRTLFPAKNNKNNKKKKLASPTSAMVCKCVSFQMKRQLLLGSIPGSIDLHNGNYRPVDKKSEFCKPARWLARCCCGGDPRLCPLPEPGTYMYSTVGPLPGPHSGLHSAGGRANHKLHHHSLHNPPPRYPRILILAFLIWIGWPSRQHEQTIYPPFVKGTWITHWWVSTGELKRLRVGLFRDLVSLVWDLARYVPTN